MKERRKKCKYFHGGGGALKRLFKGFIAIISNHADTPIDGDDYE